jgi:hypothetical protein
MKKRKVKRYQEGGETELKQRGLDLSKDDKVGFVERLKMGNIDDPRSEAYRRFGAGRAKMEIEAKTPVPEMGSDYSGRNMKSPEVENTTEDRGDSSYVPKGRMSAADIGFTGDDAEPRTLTKNKIQREAERKDAQRRAAARQKAEADRAAKAADQTKAAREMGEGYKKSAYDTEKQRQARMAKEQALETVSPESSLIGGFGLRAMKMLAQGLAGRQAAKEAAQTMGRRMEKDITPRPPQLTNEPLKIGREPLKLGMKKGGAVKKMASGGSVSSASKRADGIAQRGKTRGRIC